VIGPDAVSAAEVEIRGSDARVLRHGMAPIAPDIWENLADSRDALTQAIRTASASAGIKPGKASVVLPRRYVTVKYARLPQGSPEQIAGMVRFEAQQYVPFPIDEAVLDHQIITDAGDDMSTVMIVAARRTLVNDLLAAFDRAGIEITHVAVSSLALAEHLRGEAMPAAVLHASAERVDMAVAAAGRLLFSREADISDIVSEDEPDTIVSEIARSLAAYQNEHRSQPVERLLLTRDGARGSDLSNRLEALLQVPVQVLPEPYAVAVGAALQQGAEAMCTVNLLPIQRIEKRAEARRKTLMRLTLIAVGVLALVGIWSIQQAVAAQRKERQMAAFENRRLRALQDVLKRTQEDRDRLAQVYRTVSNGLGRDRPVVDVLKAVSDALPRGSGVFLTQLTFDRAGPVVVHGSADGHEAVTTFLTSLQASGVFEEARLGYLGDTKAAGGPGSGPALTPTAASDNRTSFMVYCRLPHRTDQDEKTNRAPGRASSTTSSAARLEKGGTE
jgi:type IV pilus assembly protein PilM